MTTPPQKGDEGIGDDAALANTLAAPPQSRAPGEASLLEVTPRDRYRVAGELAQGGIGRILRARDERLQRPVALKELLDPSPLTEERFVREALVTARLQHPAIVPVYDAGRWPSGEAFYAMKLVSGRSLEEVIAEAGTFDRRLSLLPHVIAVAEAIAYAHSEGIVHRDLKPANVLVGAFGETVVIDWGIAKDLREASARNEETPRSAPLGPDAATAETLTMAGSIMGTPAYMPPEQAAGEPVGERADVYALGAILYHVLAGAPPYEGKSGFVVLGKVLAGEPLPLASRQAGVPRDLLAIVAKAMARAPADRYPTANELALDLRRFQTGQIVGAHHYSRRERLFRFARKYRGALAMAAAALAVSAVTAGFSLSRVLEAREIALEERDRANEERARAEKKQAEAEDAQWKTMQGSDELRLLEARAAARRDPNEAVRWLGSLSLAFDRWGEARLIAAEADSYGIAKILRGHEKAISNVHFSPDGKIIATTSDDRSIGLWSVDGKLVRKLEGHGDEVWSVDFSRDGRRLASASKDGTIRIWDVEKGTSDVLRASGPEVYWLIFLSGDSRLIDLSCASKHVELRDLSTSSVEVLPGDVACPGNVAISADRRIAAYAADGGVRIVDVETKQSTLYRKDGAKCVYTALSPDARHVACYGKYGGMTVWETGTQRLVDLPGHEGSTSEDEVRGAAFSHDSALFAWSHERGQVRVLDLEKRAVRATFEDHRGPIPYLAFSPDDRWVATVSTDQTANLREIVGHGHRTYHGFHDQTSWVAFSPDQSRVVVSSWDNTARIFPFGASRDRVVARSSGPVRFASFSEDGSSILSATEGSALRMDGIGDEKSALAPLGATRMVMSEDHTLLAHATKEGTIHVRKPMASEDLLVLEPRDGAITELVLFPKNDKLVSVSSSGIVRLWDLASKAGRILLEDPGIHVAIVSPDGARVATTGQDGIVRVFPVDGGEKRSFVGHVGPLFALAFTPDSRGLVSGGYDHTLRTWDLESGAPRTTDASGLGIHEILISADGKTMYSLGSEATIRRWVVETGAPLEPLRGHQSIVRTIALSPDGGRLVSASEDGELRLWDLASGRSRVLEGHEGPITWLEFSPRGDRFASAGEDGTVRIWHDDLPTEPEALRKWIKSAAADH